MLKLLKPAKNKIAYAKVGIYGSAGSGKTRTATEIAIGLHKDIGSTKPIVVFDTEPAFSFMMPLFKKANIELYIADESRALADLMTFMQEAEEVSDIAIIDSITHVWREAQDAYLNKLNIERKRYGRKPISSLEFHHWRPIKAAWNAFTDKFLSSKLHIIVCGRAGTVYEYQEKDDGSGKKELISTGSRMATEKELGYEPSLLIEMAVKRENGKSINTAIIQKDRADVLNGFEIQMPTYQSLKGHFEVINIGGEHFSSMEQKNSQDMFIDVDEQGWDKEKRDREIWSEEIIELLKKHAPSQSTEDKQKRQDLLEQFFGTRSWTKIEKATESKSLKDGFIALKNYIENTQEIEA
jgi:hypothetical protein